LSDPIKVSALADVKMSASDAGGAAVTVIGTFLGWYE
jgi:hypothetical protein